MAVSDYVITTYAHSVHHRAEAALEMLSAQGFRLFELLMYPGHTWPADMDGGERRRFRRFLSERSLEIRTINQPNLDLNIAAAMREYSLASLSRTIELAGDLEVPHVLVGPGKVNGLVQPPREHVLGHFHRALDRLIPLTQRAGTRLLVENMPFGFLPDVESLVAALSPYDTVEVGVLYDVANGAFIDEELGAALRACGSRLELVHLSDTTRDTYGHAPIGRGDIDFSAVIRELLAIGWSENLVLEIVDTGEDPSPVFAASARRLDELGAEGRFTSSPQTRRPQIGLEPSVALHGRSKPVLRRT